MAEVYKRLKRELIHKGAVIDYYKDYVQIPNGNVAEWDFIKHKGAAAVVPVRKALSLRERMVRAVVDSYIGYQVLFIHRIFLPLLTVIQRLPFVDSTFCILLSYTVASSNALAKALNIASMIW